MANDVAQRLEEVLDIFRSSLGRKEENLLTLFQELHRILRKANSAELLQDLPRSLFTRSLLAFKTPQQSASFMKFIGGLNYLQEQWGRKRAGGRLGAHLFPEVDQLRMDSDRLRTKIYYI